MARSSRNMPTNKLDYIHVDYSRRSLFWRRHFEYNTCRLYQSTRAEEGTARSSRRRVTIECIVQKVCPCQQVSVTDHSLAT